MNEAEPRRVEIKFSVIFIDSANFPEAMIKNGELAGYNYKQLILFKDTNFEKVEVAVVGSNDPTFINNIAESLKFRDIELSLGLHRDKSGNLLVIDNQTQTPQTLVPECTTQTIKVGSFQISHSIGENQEIVLTIESETEMTAIKSSYRFPFEQKFEYEKTKREAETEIT